MDQTNEVHTKRWVIFWTVALLMLPVLQYAQIPATVNEQMVRAELQRRNLDEEEVRTKLAERGINIDNVRPEELPALQRVLEEIVREIEQEKLAAEQVPAADSVPPPKDSLGMIKSANATMRDPSKKDTIVSRADTNDIYGHHLFRDKSLPVFTETKNVQPPDDYRLSAGDEIAVSIFGASQTDLKFRIDAEGFIKPDRLPRIYLKGISLRQARELMRNRFRQFYIFGSDQFALSLSEARTITVNIFGEVAQSGSYTLPAVNTAFNALMAAGGPTDRGSVRNIKLIRNGQEKIVDVYEFLSNPSVQSDFFLENNDIILIPVAERIVRLSGAVNRPMFYELKAGENLQKLIQYAGGLLPKAYTQLVQLERFADNQERLIDLPLQDLITRGTDFDLSNGDRLIVKEIPRPIENYVSIEGEVALAGRYELIAGMTLKDLLNKGLLTENSRRDIAFLLRQNPDSTIRLEKVNLELAFTSTTAADNPVLKPQDRLVVYSLARFADKSTISVIGAVRRPIETYPFDPARSINVSEALILAGGLLPNAAETAYITRTDTSNQKIKDYIRINVYEALNNPDSPNNIILQPFDIIEVSTRDRFADAYMVQVRGAVREPGEFHYDSNMTLRDLLLLAGGLRQEAATNRIDIFRLNIEPNQPTRTFVTTVEVDKDYNLIGPQAQNLPRLQPFDQVVVRQAPEFELQRTVSVEGEVVYPGVYALISDNEKLSEIVARAGGLTREAFPEGASLYRSWENTGFVVTKLDQALGNPRSNFNLVLKEEDVLVIPKMKDLVTIRILGTRASEQYPDKFIRSGRVSVAFQGEKNAKWYVDEYAAGLTKEARKRWITVEHPNGGIEKTEHFLLFNTYPKVSKGSTVTVGVKHPKPERPARERDRLTMKEVLGESLAAITSVLTLVLLVQQINR